MMIDPKFTPPESPLEPTVGAGVYIAPQATVIGDVRLGDGVSVWPGAVLRGDIAPVEIGDGTNIQDQTVCHVANGKPCRVGRDVTVGHRAILHACTVEDGCLIGMGAIVLDDARIGAGSIVAAGALVPPGMQVAPGSMVVGLPAKIKRALSEEERAQGRDVAAKYRAVAEAHARGLYRPARRAEPSA